MNPHPDACRASLTALSALLEYPGADFPERVQAAERAIGPLGGAAPAHLARLAPALLSLSPTDREELFTGTFDVTPACVPYVSIHLFGEEHFKRGEMMAALLARYRQDAFDPRGELPDHLGVLLRFAAAVPEAERRELTEFCLLTPVARMIAALNPANPYRALLEAIRALLEAMYPGLQPPPTPLELMRGSGAACALQSAACGCGSPPALDPEPNALASPAEPALSNA